MTRVFAYCRVSTKDQKTENQLREISSAGFVVLPKRIVEECVSGSVAAMQREGFAALVDRLEESDVLIVTKLDRLGRNAMDVRATVDQLSALGVRIYCLALGGADLTSASGKMTMAVIAAVAEFEKDLLIERTHAGLERARRNGVSLGRPLTLSMTQQAQALSWLREGRPIAAVARDMRTSRQTIMRLRHRSELSRMASEPANFADPNSSPTHSVDATIRHLNNSHGEWSETL